jgi:hypothetical protein
VLSVLLIFGPFILVLGAWIKIYWGPRQQRPRAISLVALGVTSANALLAVGEFLRLWLRPHSNLPPWQDPQILSLAMLILLAPIGVIVALLAIPRGAPRWLVGVVAIASALLVAVGFLASGEV